MADVMAPKLFLPKTPSLDSSIGQFQDLAAQMADPGDYAKTGRSPLRNPLSVAMSTVCTRDKLRVTGAWADTYIGGVQQPASTAGEAWGIINQGMKYNCLVTAGTFSTLTDGILTGRMKILGNTPNAVMYATDPLTCIINYDTHFIVPRMYGNVGPAAVPIPIYAISIPTTGSTSVTRFTITLNNFYSSDPTGWENMGFTFMARNYATQVWTSNTYTAPANDFSGPAVINFNCPAGITVDAIAWYYSNGNYVDAVYNIAISIGTGSGGLPVGTIPNVASHMMDVPLVTSNAWIVDSVSLVSESLWMCCTASDLQNGGDVSIVDLRGKWRVGDLPSGGGTTGISTIPWSFSGRFRDGAYGWLQPTAQAQELHVPTRVFDDNCVFIAANADSRGDFLWLVDVVLQATSIYPLYEYRLPPQLPNYGKFLDFMRMQPHVMENATHKSVIKGFVSSVRKAVTSPEFYKFISDSADKVIRYTPRMMPGQSGIVNAARGVKAGANIGVKLTESPEQKVERKKAKKQKKKAKKRIAIASKGSFPKGLNDVD
jgi:hypothetical protein